MLIQDRIESFSRRMSADVAKLRRRSEIYDEMTTLMAGYDILVKTGSGVVYVELNPEMWQKFERLAKELHAEDVRQDRAIPGLCGYSWFGAIVIPVGLEPVLP